jgi:hypothetical protein
LGRGYCANLLLLEEPSPLKLNQELKTKKKLENTKSIFFFWNIVAKAAQ